MMDGKFDQNKKQNELTFVLFKCPRTKLENYTIQKYKYILKNAIESPKLKGTGKSVCVLSQLMVLRTNKITKLQLVAVERLRESHVFKTLFMFH